MVLVIDIGNTNIVLGGYAGEKLLFLSRLPTDPARSETEYAALLQDLPELREGEGVEGSILSSVVPSLTSVFCRAAELLWGRAPLVVGPGMETGVTVAIDDPGELGADLLAAAAAALEKYPRPQVILDLGTATTLSVLDRDGVFRGVVICPGAKTAFNALTARAAQLPGIPLGEPKRVIGTNSEDSLLSGVVYGHAAMLDGLIGRIEAELGENCTVIATGGLGGRIVPHCRREILLDENLLLDGLRILYEKNRQPTEA
jgi:type III pantothenate kinase